MIHKIRLTALPLLLFAASLILFAGCSKDDNSAPSAARLVAETVNCNTTTNKILTQGSASLTVQARIIDQGVDNWCSFDPTTSLVEATVQAGRSIFLYLTQNTSDQDRTAKILVTFSDNYTATLTLTQTRFSISADYDRAWGEQPFFEPNADYIYKTYNTTLSAGRYVRNFSVCYDRSLRVAHWVAYPLVRDYTGGSGRTDEWAYDPNDQQPEIPQGSQQYVIDSYRTGYARGHQCPSADRTINDKTNAMTFYATNIMPQDGGFNGGIWLSLENKVRANIVSDTLFVVTGTHFTGEFTRDRLGNSIGLPTNCWKVLLRTRSGATKKPIWECTADELMGIGFWFRNDGSNTGTLASYARSIAQIEQLTGFTFFRNLSEDAEEQVKAQNKFTDWN